MQDTWLAQLVEYTTPDLRVVKFEPLRDYLKVKYFFKKSTDICKNMDEMNPKMTIQ